MQHDTVRWVRKWPFLILIIIIVYSIQLVIADTTALYPVVSENAFSKGGTVINYGNAYNGYILVKREKKSSKRVAVIISKDDTDYQYDLNSDGDYEVFPLQMGDGKYKIALYQQVEGTKFSALQSKTIDVALKSKDICYLYPNQYVNYNKDSAAVAKSYELCQGLTKDEDKFKAIYKFCTEEISYNYIRAATVNSQKGYLPDIDAVLKDKMGICFDYASLMACMLRVQGVPTQVVIGHADTEFHAWNKVLLNGEWLRYDPTYKSSGGKAKTYTEERKY